MSNACFRCKAPIDSGATFCAGCRTEASLEFPYERDTRLWVVVAAAPVLVLLAGGLAAAALVVEAVPDALAVGSTATWPIAWAFAYALYRDCQHVRRRDDVATDWTPNEWAYAALAVFTAVAVAPMFLAAPYHLYRRRSAIGLVLRTGAD